MKTIVAFLLIFILAACGQAPPIVEPVIVPSDCQMNPGGEFPLSLKGSFPGNANVRWEATKGTVSPGKGISVIYVAPEESGTVIITAIVEAKEYVSTSNIVCEISAAGFFETPSIEPATQTPVEEIVIEPTQPQKEEKGPPPAQMILVPAGDFLMGSDYDQPFDFNHVRKVGISQFYLDKFEVTNVQYDQCVKAGVCAPPLFVSSNSRAHYYDDLDTFGDYPVVYVTWSDAVRYCEWRRGRLPTEAEWEYSAKWREQTPSGSSMYPWGGELPTFDLANFNSGDTIIVGKFEEGQSVLGIYDLAGNVYEWTVDFYQADYYKSAPDNNPVNTAESKEGHVVRGGAWSSVKAWDLWTFRRYYFQPDTARNDLGFRCASDTAP